MSVQHRYIALAAFSSAAALACSDGGSFRVSPAKTGGAAGQPDAPAGAAEAGAESISELDGSAAGAAGSVDEPATVGSSCSAASECDDGQPCNGEEACVEGACQAGNATTCDVGLECSNEDAGECIFIDQSPWIVYEADDDTPGVPEVYAVKRGLLGQMQPIKINAALADGWSAFRPGAWSPDRQFYGFSVIKRETSQTAVQVVYFGKGFPEAAVELDGDEVQWSPSGELLATREPHAVAIYARSKTRKIELAYRDGDPLREQYHGWWGENDSFVFASKRTEEQRWDISRAHPYGGAWETRLVVENLDLNWFSVSPQLTEIVYATPDGGQTGTYVFAHSLKLINSPIKIAGPNWSSFRWSTDGRRYALLLEAFLNGATPREVEVFVGSGEATEHESRQIAHGADIEGAGFTPDGGRLVLRRADPTWGNRLTVYDLETGVETRLGHLISSQDETRWSPDGGWLAMPNHVSETSDVELTLVGTTPSRDTLSLDSIPSTQRYYNLQFSRRNEFFAYYKGDGATRNYEAAYVDLRYHTVVDPEPVRLPGDGKMWTMNFDPDGSALYYIKEQSNGARDCFYLDLSQQVAKDVVKVNRNGRVDHCYAQPLGE